MPVCPVTGESSNSAFTSAPRCRKRKHQLLLGLSNICSVLLTLREDLFALVFTLINTFSLKLLTPAKTFVNAGNSYRDDQRFVLLLVM